MYRRLFVILALLLCGGVQQLEAQRKSPAKNADIMFERGQYFNAIERYKKAYKKTKSKKHKEERIRISYQLGECYRLTDNPRMASSQYKRVVKSDFPLENPEVYLYYADVLKRTGKYDDALRYYEMYSQAVPDDPRAERAASDVAHITEWMEFPSKYEVTRLKVLNSRASDFGVAWVNSQYNEVIFSSTREGGVSNEKDAITGQKFADFYSSRQDRKGVWDKPTLTDEEGGINSQGSDGVPYFNKSFSTVYFTRCGNAKKRQSGCEIVKSSHAGGSFSEPEVVQIAGVDSLDVIGHPTLSSNESIIYFAADRKNGFGGKDIWMSMKGDDGKFGRPFNLGDVINTPGNEMFPYLRNDSTLYFASDGHGGMGGLDIFVTTADSLGNWGEPVNLKYPVNSTGNDYGIIFHPTEERGFFISNRDSRNGLDDDIYYFIEPPVLFTVNGTVRDPNTLQFVTGANVRIAGSDGSSASTLSSENGGFQFTSSQLSLGNIYILTIDKPNYFTTTDTISTVGLEFSHDFKREYEMMMIPDDAVVLPEIQYELGKWDLQPQFEDSLQGLIEILQLNPNITIELGSHTDARGTDAHNDILSQKRAQAVCDYLVIRGIDPLRLTAKGYGERKPRTLNKDFTFNNRTLKKETTLTESYINSLNNEDLKEYAHQLNRRTEFKVISKDYVARAAINDDQRTRVSMNPNDNKVAFTQDEKTGLFKFASIINAYTETVSYNQNSEFYVSQKKVMQLLKDGHITKNDFVGKNVERIITAGAVKDRAVFRIKEMYIADRKVEDIEVTVSNKLKDDWVIGAKALKKFGNFEFNTDEHKLIFK